MTVFKTKFWSVTNTSQTPTTPEIVVTQDTWDPLLITLYSASGDPSIITVNIRVTDIIDNEGYNRNFKDFQVVVNLKSVNNPVISLANDIILAGPIPNQINCKLTKIFKYFFIYFFTTKKYWWHRQTPWQSLKLCPALSPMLQLLPIVPL